MKTRKSYGSTNFATTAMLSVLVVGLHVAGFELLASNDAEMVNQMVAQSKVVATTQDVRQPVIETIVVTATRL